jgi:hypothetical protein
VLLNSKREHFLAIIEGFAVIYGTWIDIDPLIGEPDTVQAAGMFQLKWSNLQTLKIDHRLFLRIILCHFNVRPLLTLVQVPQSHHFRAFSNS